MRKLVSITVACLILVGSFILLGCDPGDEQAQAGGQTTCSVMGSEIDKNYHVDHDGKRIYFCCAECPKEFAKKPAEYMKKLEDAGAKLEEAVEDHSSHDH